MAPCPGLVLPAAFSDKAQAHSLTAPWAVTGFDLRPTEGTIHFKGECQASRLARPACRAADQSIHERVPHRWQHLHFCQFKACIETRVPYLALKPRLPPARTDRMLHAMPRS